MTYAAVIRANNCVLCFNIVSAAGIGRVDVKWAHKTIQRQPKKNHKNCGILLKTLRNEPSDRDSWHSQSQETIVQFETSPVAKIAAVKAKHAALKQASLASSHNFRFPCINHHVVAPRHQRTD